MIRRAPVRLRTTGLTDPAGHVLIRFGTIEPHALIKSALANADRYDEVLRLLGHRSGRAALTGLRVTTCTSTSCLPPSSTSRSRLVPAASNSGENRNHFVPLLDPLPDRLEGPFPLDRRA